MRNFHMKLTSMYHKVLQIVEIVYRDKNKRLEPIIEVNYQFAIIAYNKQFGKERQEISLSCNMVWRS